MKVQKKLAALLVVAFTLLSVNLLTVLAADPVTVYLNGKQLYFTDVAPQIINGRTMVPFRETAGFLGLTLNWNDYSKTMTLQSGNRTTVHTINESFILLNGVVKNYDSSSMIVNGRTLMPIGMLAEALDATVDWNEFSRSVMITSAGDPSILSINPSKTTISPGETVTVNVIANKDTRSVRLMDDRFNLLTDSSIYSDMGETRNFVLTYTPTSDKTGSIRVIAYGTDQNGILNGEQAHTREFNLSILEDRKINSIKTSRSTAGLDNRVTITVTTNDAVTKVQLSNDYDSTTQESNNYTTSGNERVFTFSVSSSRSRKIEYTATAGSASGYDTSVYRTISVTYSSSTSSSGSSSISVSVEYDTSSRRTVTVVTGDDVERIEIQKSNGDIVAESSRYARTRSNNKLEWEVTVYTSDVSTSSTLYVYAYYDFDNDGYDRKSFTLSDSSSSSSDDYIYDFSVSPTGYLYEDDPLDIEFYTSEYLTQVEFFTPSGSSVRYYNGRSPDYDSYSSSYEYRWTARIRVEETGYYTLSYRVDGRKYTKEFYVNTR